MKITEVENRKYEVVCYISSHGRSRVVLICPFCEVETTAYVWSIAAVGKKCPCGAKFGSSGFSSKTTSTPASLEE